MIRAALRRRLSFGGDCVVDLQDLALILSAFGSNCDPSPCPFGDLDDDGDIDLADRAILLAAFGLDCASCSFT